jgi:hypothetical protein
LRKYLIVAIAALTTLAFAAVALAQTPAATMTVKITPKKAGTKAKPKNSKLTLNIVNGDSKRTLSRLTITAPKTFKLNAKGLTTCDAQKLSDNGLSACPKASKVGKGIAHALVGVNGPSPTPLTFDVTPVVLGAKKLSFYLAARELPVNVLSPGTIKGRKLIIDVPQAAQQPAPGTWAGLVSLETTLGAKKGKHMLASTVGCKKKKHAFSTVLTFIDNTVGAPGNLTVKGSSKCSA